ncbi:protein OBERON 4 [Sesamum angolense]|uniref:Protein OBERON 4 n=1 Tax=Sesamum angolense TaxID=2727404 RepID=A0AAE1XFY5_9LAMI|nr:protein OBERON 4 [Sesamum angolense]
MSFSGSQQFTHNPSCSLTYNVHDYEQSVGSKPLFQGWIGKLCRRMRIKGFGTYDNGPEYSKDQKHLMTEKDSGSLQKSNDLDGKEQGLVDIISNPGKQWQLIALQKALQKRPDVSLDMLLNAHRTQLEILALKTGLREFSLLPVDECDCKICAKRSDFCRDCMCLVYCGLRESHIRNGRSATGAQGTTEMQFYCVACDHPSEMFGFIKEVFQNFVKEWTAENLSRELEYVRRIFSASEDVRGKQLHEIAVRMLSKLANRADLKEVQNHIISFFTEMNSDRPVNIPIESRKELPTKNQEGASGIPGPAKELGG